MEFRGDIGLIVHMNPTDSEEMVQDKIKKAIEKEFVGAEIDFEDVLIYDDLGLVQRIVTEVNLASNTYPPENIDVALNEQTGCLYVLYHSDNNSFPLSEDICCKEYVDLGELESALDKLHIGHCW